ncbi:legumain-like [Ctenopharyngodon idella]|uniref:legumain-like n=1 Tax=Ctenopharyngodon idella TaxID=7959 RepID=UPI002230CEBA|nr:legumain-like [Ctenopharyngodon idella]
MSGKKWILLVAGSKGWEDYQHQANVCCLYQIIKKHGIPDEQIVVMMYDDIADNPLNPSNGIISVVDDTNVYLGVPKDYTGKDVTPENFLAALQGDDSTGKKVIKSEANDNIYVYMTGVGNEGTFEFPEKSLYPAEITGAIKNMSEENKFSKMVIFMTSSYSARMFEDFPNHVHAYALTACDKNIQSSPSDYDKHRNVYLSDKFSSTWLKYLSTADFNTETFHKLTELKQAMYIRENPGPCPCQFGDTSIANCYLSEFLQN